MAKNDAENEKVIFAEIDKWMDEFINRVFELSQENLLRNNSVDTGFLLKSGNVNRSFLDKNIVYSAIYAENVEFGRDPGSMPPPAALEKWVRRKLGVKPKDVKQVTWAIAKSIEKKGIMPRPYLQPAVLDTVTEFSVEVA